MLSVTLALHFNYLAASNCLTSSVLILLPLGPHTTIGIHSFDFALQVVIMPRNWIQEINLVSIFVYYAWYSKASKFNEQKYSCYLLFIIYLIVVSVDGCNFKLS
jgi:hypothetical protein